MNESSSIVVENIDGSILMPTGCKLSVVAQVYTHAKTARVSATRLVLADNLRALLVDDVPYYNPAIPSRCGEELAVLVESDSPDRRILYGSLGDLRVRNPFPGVDVKIPYFDLASESGARSYLAVTGCAKMVAA